MAIVPFFQIDSLLAVRETRTVTVPEGSPGDLPPGNYGFIEFFCNDPKCDCRRVIFQVWREDSGKKIWATLTYGWESPEYYAQWCGTTNISTVRGMASASLEAMSPQTKLSVPLLQLFIDVLLKDTDYVDRLKRHYRAACPNRVSGDAARTPRRFKQRKRR